MHTLTECLLHMSRLALMERRYQEAVDTIELLRSQPCTPRLWADMVLLWCQVVDSTSADGSRSQVVAVLSKAQAVLDTVWTNRPSTGNWEYARVLISARSDFRIPASLIHQQLNVVYTLRLSLLRNEDTGSHRMEQVRCSVCVCLAKRWT